MIPVAGHIIYLIFAFALGSCVGSFLNVVVYRLPRVEEKEGDSHGLFASIFRDARSLSYPPSRCPKCGQSLKWYDNLPVIGWIKLAGKCRFCKAPISVRYPIVEAITGLLFVLYYVMFFIEGIGPGVAWHLPDGTLQYRHVEMLITEHWPIYLLDMVLIGALFAASMIDAELFIIPLEIPWFVVPFALLEHALCDHADWPGALNFGPPQAAVAAGAALGILVSIIFVEVGWLPLSFADGGPAMEIDKTRAAKANEEPQYHDYSAAEVRAEIRKEMLFLMPPMFLGGVWLLLTWKVPAISAMWHHVVAIDWVSGLLGSILGLLVGGFVVWLVRIIGSYIVGREAMGLGDVHLMAAVGAVLGPGPATIAFFLAPFFGILHTIYLFATKKGRELWLGPYLSLATAAVMLFYCEIANYLAPGLMGLMLLIAACMKRLGF